MADRRPTALAALVVAGAIALASIAVGPVDAASPVESVATTVTTSADAIQPTPAVLGDIVPGSVGRSSPLLDATYDAYLRISWGTRKIYVEFDGDHPQHLGHGDRPDRAQHGRGETGEHPAPLGDGRWRRRRGHDQRPDDRRPARWRPAGRWRDRGSGCASAPRCAPASPARTGCSPMPTASSTSTAGCPGSSRRIAVRPAEPWGPVRDTDEPVGPGQDRDVAEAGPRDERRPHLGQRRRTDPDVRGHERPRLHGDSRRPTTGRGRGSCAIPSSASTTGRARRVPRCSMPPPTPSTRSRRRLGSYPHHTFRVVQSAGGYGMESPGLIWIPTGQASANLRYLAAHETAHQWFYGIVGNDQSTASRSPTRPPPTSSPVTSWACTAPAAARRRPLDRSIYRVLGGAVTTRRSTSRAAICSRRRGRRMGSTAFWVGAPRVRGRQPGTASSRPRPCSMRSTRRRRSILGRRCSRRGSRGSTEGTERAPAGGVPRGAGRAAGRRACRGPRGRPPHRQRPMPGLPATACPDSLPDTLPGTVGQRLPSLRAHVALP